MSGYPESPGVFGVCVVQTRTRTLKLEKCVFPFSLSASGQFAGVQTAADDSEKPGGTTWFTHQS